MLKELIEALNSDTGVPRLQYEATLALVNLTLGERAAKWLDVQVDALDDQFFTTENVWGTLIGKVV